MSEDSAHLTSLSMGVLDTKSPADWLPTHKLTELSKIKLEKLNATTRPYNEWISPLVNFFQYWYTILSGGHSSLFSIRMYVDKLMF